MRIILGGTAADAVGLDDVVGAVDARLTDGSSPPLVVASTNVDHVHHFGRGGVHAGLIESQTDAGAEWLVLLDGMPLVWRAQRLTGRSWPRLTGADLLPLLLGRAEAAGAVAGFLGGMPQVHAALATVLAERYPLLRVGGYWAPDRADLESPDGARQLAEKVRAAGVDLLVVGLGKPRQERWLAEHGAAAGFRVGLAFGASADFLAGAVDRVPERWRESGFEWLYRLSREPRRLARRYLLEGPPAAWHLLRDSGIPQQRESDD